MKPTEICLRAEWREENWRRSWIKEPLPKELVMEAWKASVGYSFERARTHEAYFIMSAPSSDKNASFDSCSARLKFAARDNL